MISPDSLLLAAAAFVAGALTAATYAAGIIAAFVAGARVGATVTQSLPSAQAHAAPAAVSLADAATNPAHPVAPVARPVAPVAPGVPREVSARELDASTMPIPAVGSDEDAETLPPGGWHSIDIDEADGAYDGDDDGAPGGEPGETESACEASWHPGRSGGGSGALGGLPPLLVADLDPDAATRPSGRKRGEPLAPWEAVYLCGRVEPLAEWSPAARGLRAVITMLHLASDAGYPQACAHVVLTRAEAAVVAHILRRDFGLAAAMARVGPRTQRVTAWRKPSAASPDSMESPAEPPAP